MTVKLFLRVPTLLLFLTVAILSNIENALRLFNYELARIFRFNF